MTAKQSHFITFSCLDSDQQTIKMTIHQNLQILTQQILKEILQNRVINSLIMGVVFREGSLRSNNK